MTVTRISAQKSKRNSRPKGMPGVCRYRTTFKIIVELQASARAALTSAPAMSHEEWEREFEALIDSFPQQPVLSDEAISRDSIYTREDEL